MDELVGQPTRRRILDDVEHHPGTSAREIQHRLHLGWGETAYHLDRLVRAEALRRERGGHRDYYFAADITWEDRKLLRALTSPTQRGLLLAISAVPSISFRDLCLRLEAGKSTVSFHLSRLVAQGAVEVVPTGTGKLYRTPRGDRVRALVSAHPATFGERLVESFAEAIAGLTESDEPPG